jgi:hypothetical protein
MSVSATIVMHVTPYTPIGVDGTTRERRPAVATTLDVIDTMTVAKTRAQAPIRRSPRLSAGTSSTRLSYHGIDRQ